MTRLQLCALAAYPSLAATLVLAAPTAPLRSPPAPSVAGTIGGLVGIALFLGLAAAARPALPVGVTVATAALVVGISEEIVWRAFVLARAAPTLGVGAAVVLSAIGFAAVHYPAQGPRGVAVHLVTGGTFGSLLAATGSLTAAASAHAAYNLCALAGRAAGPEPADPLLSVRGVRKRYGSIEALRGVDLTVAEGELVALLGPNGAGKTTLLDVVLGLRRADAGEVRVLGWHPGSAEARRSIGSTPQDMGFPPTLRVREIVDFVLAHHDAVARRDEVLARFGLAELQRRQAGGLSGGQRRRLAVAVAFAPEPRLALLDEPTTGLDVESRRELWSCVRDFAAAGHTVVFTTHHLDEAEALASRVVVLRQGSVVADGPPERLRQPCDASLEAAYLRLTAVTT